MTETLTETSQWLDRGSEVLIGLRRLHVTPLPAALGGSGTLVAWRLDQARHAATWDSGEGAYLAGGRWNSKGTRVVYAALDPATAILEVAVHKTFRVLDTARHVLTAIDIVDPAAIHVVEPEDVPNANWLRPCIPSAGQQSFGDDVIGRHKLVVLPSAVSTHSWNLMFDPRAASGAIRLRVQEPFALDTRLHPPS